MPAHVLAVHASADHSFSKTTLPEIELLQGLGVRGDAHCGGTVRHRFIAASDPDRPNLRQVHLIHGELLSDLAVAGYAVAPGELGENITTAGIDLLGLPTGARLHVGEAVATITGLRNPCVQINTFRAGLLKHVVRTGPAGVERLAGVMGVVTRGGVVRPGDAIEVELPPGPPQPLTTV